MDIEKRLNEEQELKELFDCTTVAPSLQNAVKALGFKHATYCQEYTFCSLFPNEDEQEKQRRRRKKNTQKMKKQKEKEEQERKEREEQKQFQEELAKEMENDKESIQEEGEDENEEIQEEKQEEKENIEEEQEQKEEEEKKEKKFIKPQYIPLSEEQKESKSFVIQSGVKSGKTTSMLVSSVNDFYGHIKEFNPKAMQKDQDEDTHGLFSVILCNSKEQCQSSTTLIEKLLMRYSQKQKSKLPNKSQFQEVSQEDKIMNSKIQIYNLCSVEGEEQFSVMPNKHYILLATPAKFLKFATTMKIEQKYYVNFAIDDLDYMISFGYQADLDNFQFHFKEQLKQAQFIMTLSSEIVEEVEQIQQKLMENPRMIDVHFDDEMDEEEEEEQKKKDRELMDRDYRIVQQYYHMGDPVAKYIILYIMYKLNFLNGKTLIVCPDVNAVYKINLFLQRIGVKGMTILNEEDPKSLRYYVLSMFNTGMVNTLITTDKVFYDLEKKVFYQKKRKVLNFKNLNNIINLDLVCVKDYYNDQYKYFRGSEGSIINLLDQTEDQIEVLTNAITKQKKDHEQINIKEFPLKKSEVDAFTYRISDVVTAISNKQLKNARMVDFKKKLLKCKELEKYFEENQAERNLLIEDINKLSQQIHKYGVQLREEIPDYLVPEMIREQRKKMDKGDQKFTKIQVTNTNEDFKESLKRRMEANNLTLADVKKKKLLDKISNDKYVYVNNDKEAVEGEEIDPKRLKIISGRKLWKQRHGFKTKKRNRRLERKGIHNE